MTLPWKNGWLELMSSYNRLLSICTCLKTRRCHNYFYHISLRQFLFCKGTVSLKMMHDCNCPFVIKKVYLSNWCLHLELRVKSIHLNKKGSLRELVSKKRNILGNTWSLQVVSWNNDGTTQMYRCKCSFEITIQIKKKHVSSSLHIRISWFQVLFKKIPYVWLQLFSWKKDTLYCKKISFLQLNTVTYKEKKVFKNNYLGLQPFLMSYYFIKIFVCLSVIAAFIT